MLHKNMIYKLSILFLSITSLTVLFGMHHYKSDQVQSSLSKCVIRFHVRANSDTLADQSLKMNIKDAVVSYMNDNADDFHSLEDAKSFIATHDEQLNLIAYHVMEESGYSYTLSSSFDIQEFPNKTYGDISFPSGKYLSYTMNIGSGTGHNWWCVLYPPLCFVDASTGILPDESKEVLKENISKDDYSYVSENETIFRFKYLTFLNGLLE